MTSQLVLVLVFEDGREEDVSGQWGENGVDSLIDHVERGGNPRRVVRVLEEMWDVPEPRVDVCPPSCRWQQSYNISPAR